MERGVGGDPPPAYGGSPVGGAYPADSGAVRSGGSFRDGEYRLPGDHRQRCGGGGPLRAPAALRRGPPSAGARPPGQRAAAGLRLPHRPAGAELAAADFYPPDGEAAPGGAYRVACDGYKDHPGGRACPRKAHRRRRLPSGHLPGGTPGPDAGGGHFAGAPL